MGIVPLFSNAYVAASVKAPDFNILMVINLWRQAKKHFQVNPVHPVILSKRYSQPEFVRSSYRVRCLRFAVFDIRRLSGGISVTGRLRENSRRENQPQSTRRSQSVVVFLCALCELCGFSILM